MEWEMYARRLSAEVTDPMSRWRPLVAATPRHVFVPRWWRWAGPEGWTACDGEAGQQRWMDAAYGDRTLITPAGHRARRPRPARRPPVWPAHFVRDPAGPCYADVPVRRYHR